MDKLEGSNLIDDWLNKNGIEEIKKQVELEIMNRDEALSKLLRMFEDKGESDPVFVAFTRDKYTFKKEEMYEILILLNKL